MQIDAFIRGEVVGADCYAYTGFIPLRNFKQKRTILKIGTKLLSNLGSFTLFQFDPGDYILLDWTSCHHYCTDFLGTKTDGMVDTPLPQVHLLPP